MPISSAYDKLNLAKLKDKKKSPELAPYAQNILDKVATGDLDKPQTEELTPTEPTAPKLPTPTDRAEQFAIKPMFPEPMEVKPLDLESMSRQIFPEMFDPRRSYGYTEEQIPAVALEQLQKRLQLEPELFIRDLYSRTEPEIASEYLRSIGLEPQLVSDIEAQITGEDRVKTLLAEALPQFTAEETEKMLTENPEQFIEELQTGGRAKEKQDLLREIGFDWAEIDEMFRHQQLVIPIEGVRQKVTVDTATDRAYDDKGRYLGTYNIITREFSKAGIGDMFKDFVNAWSYASIGSFENIKQFGLTILPQLLFRDQTALERKINGDEAADEINRRNRQNRDLFRAQAAEGQRNYEEWISKHPELQPNPIYEEGAFDHPELWKDPNWWAYEIASMAPMTLTAMGTGGLATLATGGNIFAGAIAAGLTFGPVEAYSVYEDLLSEGVPEEQAAQLSAIVAVPIVLTESAGTYLQLTRFLPQIKALFRREATKQVVKLTVGQLAKKGLKTFTTLQFTETMEEVIQEALGNTAVIIAGKDRSLFENIPELLPKVTAGMLPFSLIGTGVSLIRVSPSVTRDKSSAELRSMGLVQDPKDKNAWYEKVKTKVEEIQREERGAIGVPEEPEGKPDGKPKLTPEKYIEEQTKGMTPDEIGKLRTDLAVKKEKQITLTRQYGDEFVDKAISLLDKKLTALEEKPEPKPAPVEPISVPEVKATTTELGGVVSGLQEEVEKASTELKGKRGEQARISRQALSGLERELKFAQTTLKSFQEQANVPEATMLRSTIMAMANFKGISKTQLQKIQKEVGGKRSLRSITSPQLLEILGKVREARPVRIKGSKVVTLKTEKKIQSLKESLITNRQLTDKVYEKIKERLKLLTDRYETAKKFISETDARELIRAMNDEVVFARWDIKVEDALAKSPEIKEAWDNLNTRGGTEVSFDGKPIKIGRGNELRSMRYYMLNLQKKMGAPIYDAWQKINQAHLVARDRHNQQIARLEQVTPKFKEIVSDEAALRRIEDYIASKNNMAKIKAPELSPDELLIAEELQRGYFEAQNDVRFIRFQNAYAENDGDIDFIAKEIPNANKKALRRAIDIYESKGADELRKFTDTQSWGVRGQDYDPRSFIKPALYYRAPKETTFAKGLLRTRTDVEYQADDTNIVQRYARHQKQLIALQEMSPLVRAFGRLYAENAPKLDSQAQRVVPKVLSRGLNEMKGYREDGGAIVHFIERLYGQVASAVFWRPDLVLRNKFQNFAFNPDYWAGRFIDPRNKPLSAERRRWFEVFVSQERAFLFDFLLYGEKAFPGFGRITRWARNTSLYPWSDKSNRAEAFLTRINRVDRALEVYEKDGDVTKLINDSGLSEFEPRQQAEALELLAMDSVDYGIDGMPVVSGKEAFALYSSQQLVNNVHFLYDRSQRAPAEMGATGKTLGNILVFNRSWGERLLLQAQKLDPKAKATMKEKLTASTVIIGIITAGLIAGATYQKLTGKRHNPYNPLNIISWTPGGLALGVTEDISNTIYLMTKAIEGDKSALSSLPGVISNVATLTIPFYKNAVQAFDAVSDMKGIDVYALRKLREMIDDEYEVRGGVHEVERTLMEKLQRALFSKYDEPETAQEKVEKAEEQLGLIVEQEAKPFNLEEPEIYDVGKLFGRFSQILANVKPEEITKENGYTDLAKEWKERETYEDIWNTLPNKKLYQITELPEELAKWAGRHKRELSLVTEYNSLNESQQRDFLEIHPELKVNPGTEWLKQFPLANARLALNGSVKLYTYEAYEEYMVLVRKLDIPDNALPDKTLPPSNEVAKTYFERQDIVASWGANSWEDKLLRAKNPELNNWLGLGAIDTPTASLELKIKNRGVDTESQEYRDNERKIDAIENNGEEFTGKWVERGKVVDKFGASSAEAKLWLIDNTEVHEWALDNNLLVDDGSDWDEARLRLGVELQQLKEGTPEHTAKSLRLKAYDRDLPEDQIDNYVYYSELLATGYRRDRFLVENKEFAEAMGLQVPERVPSEEYDIIFEQGEENWTPEDKLAMDAYKKYVPDKQVDNYVSYYSLSKPGNLNLKTGTDLWFEDDWFLMEHKDYYKEVYLGVLDNERKDYRTVPSREIFAQYLEYLKLNSNTERRNYRFENQDLDKWGQERFGWVDITEQKRREELTPLEKAKEDVWTQEEEWKGQLADIEKTLEGFK